MNHQLDRILFLIIGVFLLSNMSAQSSISIHDTQHGIRLEDDQFYISEENRKLLSDESYREAIYPTQYSWKDLLHHLAENKIQLAQWYLINLYEDAPLLTIQVLKDLTKAKVNAKSLVNTFHTYIYSDPELVQMGDGSYQLLHPDLMEKKAKITNVLASFAERIIQQNTP